MTPSTASTTLRTPDAILAELWEVKRQINAEAGYRLEEAGLRMIANQETELGVEETLQVLRTVDGIEELDDVQNVYHNMKISEEAMAALENE